MKAKEIRICKNCKHYHRYVLESGCDYGCVADLSMVFDYVHGGYYYSQITKCFDRNQSGRCADWQPNGWMVRYWANRLKIEYDKE